MGKNGKSLRTDALVTIQVGGGVTVEPADALLKTGASLEWRVRGLRRGQSLELDFHVEGHLKGPFAKEGGSGNPHRGRYVFEVDGNLCTAESERAGYWKYDVLLRSARRDLAALDPGVMIKDA